MPLTRSKLTSQGQISIPAEVRRKLGVGPGSILEWKEESGKMVVRRAGRYTSADIHQAVFGNGRPESKTLENLKDGVRRIQKRHARA
jgi:antitoxin PrlF